MWLRARGRAAGQARGDTMGVCPTAVVDGRIERRTTLWRMHGVGVGTGPGTADDAEASGAGGGSSRPSAAHPDAGAHDAGGLGARGDLEELVVFPATERRSLRVLWDPHTHPGAASSCLLTVDEHSLRLWSLNGTALLVCVCRRCPPWVP